MAVDYKKQAKDELQPQTNAQIEQMKQDLASKLAGYNTQKSNLKNSYGSQVNTLNTNYKMQSDNQNLNNTLTKNNYNNNTSARGLGRSTVYTSGIAGLDDKNTRVLGQIDTAKNNDLTSALNTYTTNNSAIDGLINQAGIDTNNGISRLNNDLAGQIATLARTLEDRQWNKDFQTNQFNADQAYRNAQLALQKSYGGYSSGGSGGSSKPKSTAPKASTVSDINQVVKYNANPRNKLKVLKQMENEYLNNGDTKSASLARKAFVNLNTSKETRQAVSNNKLSKLLSSAGL